MSRKKAAAKKEDPAYGFAQKRRTPTASGSSSVFSIAQGGANVNSRLEHAPEKENADGVGVRLSKNLFGWFGGPQPSKCNPNPATCAADSEALRSKVSLHCFPPGRLIEPRGKQCKYSEKDAIGGLFRHADADGVGVYDLYKVRASNWFSDGRVQFPAISDQAGLIYSIFDAGSPVKRKEPEQTPQNKVRGSKNL